MRKTLLWVVLAVAAVAAATGWTFLQRSAGPAAPVMTAAGYYEWTAKDLRQALGHKDFTLINVHIPFAGRIRGTDREIPYDQIAASPDLPADHGARIVLYCSSGRMSDIAATALVKAGYTNIINLAGGMQAWQAAGYSLESK